MPNPNKPQSRNFRSPAASMTRPWMGQAVLFAAFAMILTLAGSLVATTAFADARVQVRVRTRADNPVDGNVTLRARDGETEFSCTTEEGECNLEGVPGGLYSVQFTPTDGEALRAQTAMIAPSGTVTLVVSADPPAESDD